jgi:four helix bundle protein
MHSYRSLVAWQQAHAALLGVLRATDAAYHPRAKNLFDQLRRATISIEANVVEGYALNTAPLCRRHIRIAIGSAAEAECLVRAVTELEYLDAATAKTLEASIGMALGALRGLMRAPPAVRT